VSLTDSSTADGLVHRQVSFLNTVLHNDRLARYIVVVKLSMGKLDHIEGGDPRISSILGQSMKKLVNLKRLEMLENPYIMHTQLDSVPFSLTHLSISGTTCYNLVRPYFIFLFFLSCCTLSPYLLSGT